MIRLKKCYICNRTIFKSGIPLMPISSSTKDLFKRWYDICGRCVDAHPDLKNTFEREVDRPDSTVPLHSIIYTAIDKIKMKGIRR